MSEERKAGPSKAASPDEASSSTRSSNTTKVVSGAAGSLKPSQAPTPGGGEDSDDEGDDRPDLDAVKQFASQIQYAPSGSLSSGTIKKVVIPKRGEKDFEPLEETVNLQEKMLRESRQAFFDGLGGVRGTSNKNMSHAILRPNKPFPEVVLVRGNLFLTTGHTVRTQVTTPIPSAMDEKGKAKVSTTLELLPEEALYLLERGSMQIWHSRPDQIGEGDQEWSEEEHGYKGCWEMTAMEAFDTFIGSEGLSMERYQVYASLRRLGYVVQRTAVFLPPRFRQQTLSRRTTTEDIATAHANRGERGPGPGFRPISIFKNVWSSILTGLRKRWDSILKAIGLRQPMATADVNTATLLGGWSGRTYYAAAFSNLSDGAEIYAPLKTNPYLPFYLVWKPNASWSKAKWECGSENGLQNQPPSFWVGVVDARRDKFPSYDQMHEIFPMLSVQRAPLVRQRYPAQKPATNHANSSVFQKLARLVMGDRENTSQVAETPVNTFADLKQGDRTLVVAVNDGGNIGWVRLARGTFENHIMVPTTL